MSKEEAIEILSEMRSEYNLFGDEEEATRYHVLSWAIKEMNAEPVRHGHWVDMGDFESCSVCNGTHLKEYQTYYGKCLWVNMDYCPHCGAKMDESTMGQEKPSDKEFTLYADEKPIVTFKDSKIVLHGERREDAKTN